MNIVVLGSGGWGTAAAMLLSDNGHTVALWSHDPKKAELLDKTRENPLLKGVRIPERIAVTSDLAVLQNAEMAVFASPSFALRSVAHEAAPHLKKGTLLVSLTKGIERGTHLRMSEIIAQECGEGYRIAVLSGPSHAEEVARRLPTGCVAASADQASAEAVQRAFMNEVFRVYTHDDVVGVELAGALKNVAALCCGISDGCGMGDNTRALLITRALSEISRLAECMGGRKETLAGLAGMGDRLEIQGRSRRIELELLTLFRRIRHGNGRRYEIEIVGNPVEIVRKTRVHVTADTEDHLLVFTRNDELGQTGLAKPLFDRRIVQIDHLGRRHRVHFGPPAVDKKHIGFRIVLQHLGLQALRKETCDDRCCKKYTMFHNYGI